MLHARGMGVGRDAVVTVSAHERSRIRNQRRSPCLDAAGGGRTKPDAEGAKEQERGSGGAPAARPSVPVRVSGGPVEGTPAWASCQATLRPLEFHDSLLRYIRMRMLAPHAHPGAAG
ncbi:hypothetical protein COCNU_scaffold001181G000020 [Cocos nucifera]|nr:hypothetical protein [Cocos nucifera]